MLYNAYTVNKIYPVGVQFGVVNYWTSNSAVGSGIVGDYFPTFIRISGVLQGIAGSADKMAIFFTNLDPFYENSIPENDNTVSCTANWNPNLKCKYYPSNN